MHKLDDPLFVRKSDPKGMYDLAMGFPAQCREALSIARSVDLPDSLKGKKAIVVAGMGGSAAGGDFLRALMEADARVPVVVLRDYGLPNWADQDVLVIACSYSGNTEETLSAARLAKERGCAVLAVTSGGELAAMGFPTITIPGGFPPRMALGYLFVPLLSSAAQLGYLEDGDATSAFDLLDSCASEWNVERGIENNEAKRLADSLYGCVPLIYGVGSWAGLVANRWKGQLCENAKVLAFANAFPELNHNEIMGWELSDKQNVLQWSVVVLESGDETAKMRRRVDVTCDIIRGKTELHTIRPRGNRLLERILSLTYFGDFASLFLAALYEVDPHSIDSINRLKSELAKIN